MKSYFVYIMASNHTGTLYIGITNDLVRRVNEHAKKTVEGFTKKYDVQRLVYFEETNSVEAALNREKLLKKWNRAWKIELIEKENPHWRNLALNF